MYTHFITMSEMCFHSCYVCVQFQHLRPNTSILPLELCDFSLQCYEILTRWTNPRTTL